MECRIPNNSKERQAFFSDQCKEIEENNRMGKTRDPSRMGTVNDRNDVDLTEADLRRDVKNTQKNYTKKMFMT